MENKYYLAVDIGASSGRHILAHRQNGKMILEEIYRFPNITGIRYGMWISFMRKF